MCSFVDIQPPQAIRLMWQPARVIVAAAAAAAAGFLAVSVPIAVLVSMGGTSAFGARHS